MQIGANVQLVQIRQNNDSFDDLVFFLNSLILILWLWTKVPIVTMIKEQTYVWATQVDVEIDKNGFEAVSR